MSETDFTAPLKRNLQGQVTGMAGKKNLVSM
jgi:hypothetical protein